MLERFIVTIGSEVIARDETREIRMRVKNMWRFGNTRQQTVIMSPVEGQGIIGTYPGIVNVYYPEDEKMVPGDWNNEAFMRTGEVRNSAGGIDRKSFLLFPVPETKES